jgi:hypothetical protein
MPILSNSSRWAKVRKSWPVACCTTAVVTVAGIWEYWNHVPGWCSMGRAKKAATLSARMVLISLVSTILTPEVWLSSWRTVMARWASSPRSGKNRPKGSSTSR